MDYTLLTQGQKDQIALRKLLDLEAEHYGLEMDVKVAISTDVHNDNVINAQQQVILLARQINLLRSWLLPPEPEEDVAIDASANGQELAEVD